MSPVCGIFKVFVKGLSVCQLFDRFSGVVNLSVLLCSHDHHVVWVHGGDRLPPVVTPHCTTHITLIIHTAHITLLTEHYTYHTEYCILHTTQSTLHTACCILHKTHITQHTAHCILQTTHITLHTAFYILYTTHNTLHTEHCTPH